MIDTGTIGSAKCEISLNELLIKLNDEKISHRVLSRHNRLREGLNKINEISDKGFRKHLMKLFYRSCGHKTSTFFQNA